MSGHSLNKVQWTPGICLQGYHGHTCLPESHRALTSPIQAVRKSQEVLEGRQISGGQGDPERGRAKQSTV